MSSTMPLWFTLIISIVILYIIISIALYYLQDYALFKPEKLPEDFQFYYDNQETKEYNLTTRDGAIINGLRFMPKGESKGIGPVIMDMNCTNCGRCIDVCAKRVFTYSSRFNNSTLLSVANKKEVAP